MTSTSFNVGLQDSGKSSSKVLKPPGGGCSDIFGAAEAPSPRAVRNHMQSNLFAPANGNGNGNGYENGRRGTNGQDSYNRLFGSADKPSTAAKNTMRSNITFDEADNRTPAKLSNGSSSPSTPKGIMPEESSTEGNPVTGEGYRHIEINTDIPSLNGNSTPINRNRIPPGGYSSGLW